MFEPEPTVVAGESDTPRAAGGLHIIAAFKEVIALEANSWVREESTVPVYVHCPHCEHPAIVRRPVPGKTHRCRQCAGFFTLQITYRRRRVPRPIP